MNDLPPIPFFAYLIITVLGCAAAAILAQAVLGRDTDKSKGKLAFAGLFTLIAVGLYFGMRSGQVWVSRLVDSPTPTARTSSPTPTPAPTPALTPEEVQSVAPRPLAPSASFVSSFIRGNIAPSDKSLRKTGQWAVMISGPEGQENYSKLASAVSSVIGEAGHSTVTIFRPSATYGAGFDRLFAADPELSRRLNEYCDKILLGKVMSSTQDNPDYPGLHKVTITIHVKIISTTSGDVQQLRTNAVGADYELEIARSNAEENLAASLRSELHNIIR